MCDHNEEEALRDHLQDQIKEALGNENRWYASEWHGREVTNPDELIQYFITHGGAEHFRKEHSGANQKHSK